MNRIAASTLFALSLSFVAGCNSGTTPESATPITNEQDAAPAGSGTTGDAAPQTPAKPAQGSGTSN